MPQTKIDFGRFRPPPAKTAIALGAAALLAALLAWADADRTGERERAAKELGDLLASAQGFADEALRLRATEESDSGERLRRIADEVAAAVRAPISEEAARRGYSGGAGALDWFVRLAFDGGTAEDADWPETALVAAGPGLMPLVPATGRIEIREGSRLLLGMARATPGDRPTEIQREIPISAGGRERRWSLRISAGGERESASAALAAHLTARLGLDRRGGEALRGFLLDAQGKVIEVFPSFAPGPRLRPLPARNGEWVAAAEGGRVSRLEQAAPFDRRPWTLAFESSLPSPSLPRRAIGLLFADRRGLGLVAAAGFVVLAAAAVRTRREPSGELRFVRRPGLGAAPDGGTVFAEIDDGPAGPVVRIEEERPAFRPGESLRRLQALHRGSAEAAGARILDLARSQILRDLATRVRPPSAAAPRRGASSPVRRSEAPCTKPTGR